MKKILFLFLISIAAYGQADFPEGVQISGGQPTSLLDPYVTTTSSTGLQGKVAPENIPLTIIPPPTHYTPVAADLQGHFKGINNAIGNIVATTAGNTTRVWFTGDQATIGAGTFYLSNANSRGTVATASQSVTNDDNQKKYFTQDLIGQPFAQVSTFPPGVYSGSLSASTSPNSAKQRFTVELYRCDNNGTPIASGVSGAPVGDLGVTVIIILDSGELNLSSGSIMNVPVSNNLTSAFTINTGERVRYHVSAEKVGTDASNIIESVYYGTAYNSYLDVPVPLNSSGVTNVSTVTGATVTVALDNLNTLKANDANVVHKTGDEIITNGVKSFLGKVYIGTTAAIGTENVSLKSDIINTGNVVTRAGQFYSTQEGTQSFTGIDVQTDAKNLGAVDHVATNQNYTKLNNTGSLDKAWGVYHVGDKLSGAGVVNNAYGFYHAGWGGTIGKKWSFYAASDYMFISSSSGIAINTFSPQELIDMENGNANGLGAKFNNAWAGNYNFSGAIASYGHYAMKSINAGLAFLQLADGTTFLNSNTGRSTYLTAGLVNAARITPSSKVQIGNSVDDSTPDTGEELQVLGEIKATGTVTASPATVSTELVTKGQLDAAISPSLIYKALLTQSGTSAPTATVLENTLGGTVTFGYISTGVYTVNCTSCFASNKTFVLMNSGVNGAYVNGINLSTTSQFFINTTSNTTGSAADSGNNATAFEIRVYP